VNFSTIFLGKQTINGEEVVFYLTGQTIDKRHLGVHLQKCNCAIQKLKMIKIFKRNGGKTMLVYYQFIVLIPSFGIF
jgi:hypothetical protein